MLLQMAGFQKNFGSKPKKRVQRTEQRNFETYFDLSIEIKHPARH